MTVGEADCVRRFGVSTNEEETDDYLSKTSDDLRYRDSFQKPLDMSMMNRQDTGIIAEKDLSRLWSHNTT